MKSKKKAIQALEDALPRVSVEQKGRIYHISIEGSDIVTMKTKTPALAFLAELAMNRGLDPSDIGWTGKVPTRGLSAWEEAALLWLAG